MDSNNNRGNLVVRERKEPAFKDGETNCLGLCMKSKEALIEIAGILTAEDFYWQEHQHIYAVIVELFKANQHVDVVTVNDSLNKKGLLEAAKGRGYLNILYDVSLDVTQASSYANQVREWSVMRSLAQENERINSIIYSGDISNPIELINSQSKNIYRATDRLNRGALSTMEDLFEDASTRYEEAYRTKKTHLGHPTGFRTLDIMTGGFQDNDYIVLAARSNAGKTALGLQFAAEIAVKEKVPSLIFSLEMSKDKLLDRLVAMYAKVDSLRMRKGDLSNEEYDRVQGALQLLSNSPLLIQDSSMGNSTVLEIQSSSLKMLNKYGKLGMVMIDYIDLIEPPHYRADGHAQLSDISKQLNKMKMELPAPLVVLAQLNRNSDNRSDKRPIPTDIGGTDRIYRDADVVLFLHDPNPSQTLQQSYQASAGGYAAKASQLATNHLDREMELIVGKQRNGPKGMMNLVYRPQINKFVESS